MNRASLVLSDGQGGWRRTESWVKCTQKRDGVWRAAGGCTMGAMQSPTGQRRQIAISALFTQLWNYPSCRNLDDSQVIKCVSHGLAAVKMSQRTVTKWVSRLIWNMSADYCEMCRQTNVKCVRRQLWNESAEGFEMSQQEVVKGVSRLMRNRPVDGREMSQETNANWVSRQMWNVTCEMSQKISVKCVRRHLWNESADCWKMSVDCY